VYQQRAARAKTKEQAANHNAVQPQSSLRPAIHPVLALQRTIGNRAVQRMIQTQSNGLSVQRQGDSEEYPAMGAGVEAAQEGSTILDATFQALAGTGSTMERLFGDKSVAGHFLSVVNAGLELGSDKSEGQGWGESAAGTAGSTLFDMAHVSGGPADTAINVANAGLNLIGAPQGATDVSQTLADLTPSSFGGDIAKTALRGAYNFATGDTAALSKQFDDITAGKAGAPLQGYALLPQVIAGVTSGEDLESVIMKVGSEGQDSPAARIGNYLGDQTYQFINKDLPEAARFAKKDLSNLWNSITGNDQQEEQ
jgi:hypothetical protein